MADTIVNNQKWAYFGLSKQGKAVPRMGKPDPYFVYRGSVMQIKYGDPTKDPLALAYMFKDQKIIMPGQSDKGGQPPVPLPPKVIANRISFSNKGAAIQWASAPEEEIEGYYIERSHEPGHPLWSFRRITPAPINQLTYQDLWAWEGDSVSYRIFTKLKDGSVSFRAQLTGVQTPFTTSDKTVKTQFVIDGTNTASGQLTVFENYHFRPGDITIAVKVRTSNRVELRNCTGLTSSDFVNANGAGNVRITNCLIKGKIPVTKNYSAGCAFKGDYQQSFGANNNVVRDMAGWYMANFRGVSAANGGSPTQIYGNVYHNINRKRSDGQGGSLAEETIASVYREGAYHSGTTDPNKSGGFVVPIGWEFANILNSNGTGQQADGLAARFFGGINFDGNLMIQEPGRGLGEDAFNFYGMGGEPNAWIKIRGYCVINNWGNGINAAGQVWQTGMPWHMGNNKQPANNYTPGVTQPAGEFKLNFQSMTGGLMQDAFNKTYYQANGAYVLVEDAWLIGPGTTLGTQHSHDMIIRRAKVLYAGTDQSGTLTITGDPRIGIYMDNYDGTTKVENQQVGGIRLGIQDTVTIAPKNMSRSPTTDTRWLDPALTFNNTHEDRFATRAEEEAGYHEFLMWCYNKAIKLGPVYPAPAVIYS